MLATSLTAAVLGVEAHLVRVEADSAPGFPRFTMVGLAGLRGEGERGPHPGGAPQLRLPLQVGPAHHRQPRPGQPPQGRLVVRPRDRGRPARRGRRALVPPPRLRPAGRRAGPRRRAPARGRRPADAPRGAPPRPRRRRRARGEPPRGVARPRDAGLPRGLAARGALAPPARASCPGPRPHRRRPAAPRRPEPDLADVRGQALARRALEIAAAGGHNLLLVGPPGSGKTMLARRLPGILPPPSADEAVETAAIHSAAGLPGRGGHLRAGPSAAPTTRRARSPSSAAASDPAPARSASPTTGCCSSTSCPSSVAPPWRSCGSPSRRAT